MANMDPLVTKVIHTSDHPTKEETTLLLSGTPYTEDLLKPAEYMATGIYLTVIGLIAAVGNTSVICTIMLNKSLLLKTHNLLILNLAISDFGIVLFGYPFVTSSSFAGNWLHSEVGCKFYAFATFFFTMAALDTLVAICVYRYIIICNPSYSYKLSKKFTLKVIISCWIYSLFWTVMPFLGWSSYTYEPFKTSCTIDWTGKSLNTRSYSFVVIIFCYLLHLGILCYYYLTIIKTARAMMSGRYTYQGILMNGMRRQRINRETRVTRMCVLMVFAFLVAWTPYALASGIAIFIPLPLRWTLLPSMFAKSSPCFNPIVYTFCNTKFRKAVYKTLCCCCHGSVQPATEHPFVTARYRPRLKDEMIFYIGRCPNRTLNKEGIYIPMEDSTRLFLKSPKLRSDSRTQVNKQNDSSSNMCIIIEEEYVSNEAKSTKEKRASKMPTLKNSICKIEEGNISSGYKKTSAKYRPKSSSSSINAAFTDHSSNSLDESAKMVSGKSHDTIVRDTEMVSQGRRLADSENHQDCPARPGSRRIQTKDTTGEDDLMTTSPWPIPNCSKQVSKRSRKYSMVENADSVSVFADGEINESEIPVDSDNLDSPSLRLPSNDSRDYKWYSRHSIDRQENMFSVI